MIPLAEPRLGDAEHDAVREVLDSGYLADGPEVRTFEEEFAEFCGTDHAVAAANGTAALHAAFEALGVGAGDHVVTSPFSFVASANAVRLAGAEPVFADVDPETYCLDPDAVEAVLAERDDVAAILAVHLYGLPADLGRLRRLADRHGVALVEDAAQAHGAAFRGRRAGAVGDAACFSFYPTKNCTTGEGGMVTTDDPVLAERVARYVNHGRPTDRYGDGGEWAADGGTDSGDGDEGHTGPYDHAAVGHNLRLTSVGAAIGREQLRKLPGFNEARRANADYLDDLLADADVRTPVEPAGRRHVYNQYTVRHEDRDGLADHLAEAGVDTGVYYPRPIHEQPAYSGVEREFPVAERAAREVLSLPVHPGCSKEDLETVAAAVESYGGERR